MKLRLIGLNSEPKYQILVREGKWKYELQEEVTVTLHSDIIGWELFQYIPLGGIDTPYYKLKLADWLGAVQLTIRKGYAYDGVTGAAFMEDTRTLFLALLHDVFMQAIYDDKLLPRSLLQPAHKVFLIPPPCIKHKLMYVALKYLHTPWNKLTN